VHHLHGLALDPRDPDALYVATYTGLVRVRPGDEPEWLGAHRFDLMGFTADPRQPGVVYASGHPDLATYRREKVGNLGLLVSRDGGRTWQSVALKGQADFHALAFSPRAGGELYGWSVTGETGLHRISVGTWAVERLPGRGLADVLALAASQEPGGPLLAGTRRGLMESRDRGATWSAVGSLPGDAPVTAVGVHPMEANRAYAYVARPGLGLMESVDGGASWTRVGLEVTPHAVVAIAVSAGGRLAVATTGADVLRSDDGGRSWARVLEQGRVARGAVTR
jgi:photosystem II stability/assembly factor-like uncharacterized protein